MFCSYALCAQTPVGIPYQSVIRSSNGAIMLNHNVKMRFRIHYSIPRRNIEYEEIHLLTTNTMGLYLF